MSAGLLSATAPAPIRERPVTPADSSVHNLVAIEFVESPPSGFAVAGGLLGVPDSSGRFPPELTRFDPVTGRFGSIGRGIGSHLVFADLGPGSYRVGLVLLEESRLASRILPKHSKPLEDRCPVYSDTMGALTFTIGSRDIRYLGKLTRKSRPTLEGTELWENRLEWSAGDERRTWKAMRKSKDLARWKDLIEARLALCDSAAAAIR